MEQNQALNVLVQAVNVAQKRGAYKLDEANVIAQAVSVFTKETVPEITKEENDTLIKVRRGYKVYRVKVWDPPVVKEKIKKSKADYKKDKNDKRRSKYSDKKIRARQEQS